MSIDIYIDLDRMMLKLPDGNIKKTNSMDTIHQSIKNILATVPGERVMLPTFGSRLRYLLFEPLDEDTAVLINNEIRNSIGLWEDRVRVTNVSIEPDYDRNIYNVVLSYVLLVSNVEYILETNLRSLA